MFHRRQTCWQWLRFEISPRFHEKRKNAFLKSTQLATASPTLSPLRHLTSAPLAGGFKMTIYPRASRAVALALAWLTVVSSLSAQRGDKPDSQPGTAESERATFHLPPGFAIQLVADETQIQKPMNLSFDADGRLWVTGSTLYPFAANKDALGRIIPTWQHEWDAMKGSIGTTKPKPPGEPVDSVRVLSDFGPDGRARRVQIFADGLNVPIGVLPLPRKPGAKGDTVIVYSIPSIWRLEDTDGDGRADVREELYTGFGFIDTHGMSSNYLYWVDGWIYGCHGFSNHSEITDRHGHVTVLDSGNTYRFKPDGSAFESYTHGQTNPFGLTVDPWGNFYSADSHSKPVYLLLPGAYYEGINKKHDGLGFAPAITSDSHGSSAIAGIAWYADNAWPEEFRGNVFIGNPVTQRINRDRFNWIGSTPMAERMPDFLSSDDPWFRPIQVKLGPDGALYIADFYVPIIGHYEQPLLDPRRDHAHGRIWRMVWTGDSAAPVSPPKLSSLSTAELWRSLDAPNLTLRTLAVHELVARGDTASLRSLLSAADPAHPLPALALWVAERLGSLPDDVLARCLASPNEETAIHAIHLLGERSSLSLSDAKSLRALLTTPAISPRLVRAAIQALARHPDHDNLRPLVAVSFNEQYSKDTELQFALRVALRENLQIAGAFDALEKIHRTDDASSESLADTAPVLLADVALALPTPESAHFLLRQLARLNDAATRTGEYVGHAAKYLPFEQVDQLLPVIAKARTAPTEQQFDLAEGLIRATHERTLPFPPDVVAWIDDVLLAAVNGPDEKTKSKAVAALKYSPNPAKLAPLVRIMESDTPFGRSARSAALDAVMDLPSAPLLLEQAVMDSSRAGFQQHAIDLLVKRGDTALAFKAISKVSNELARQLAPTLVTSDENAMELLGLIERGKVSATILQPAKVASLVAERGVAVRENAARLTRDLPPENVRLAGVIATRLAAVRDLKADPVEGARLFSINCMACHKYRDQGGSLAPNLDGVAARGTERIAEDILDPSRNVDGAFRQTVIETNDGRTIGGLNLRETPDGLTLTEASGADVRVARSEVKRTSTSPVSLMPSTFETVLSEHDFANLISYLTSSEPAPAPASRPQAK
jgi:putative heme-binding domain-containing protein